MLESSQINDMTIHVLVHVVDAGQKKSADVLAHCEPGFKQYSEIE